MSEPLNKRPACSLPMADADPKLGNFNWTKGLQSQADWTWSGNLNPEQFPNNLARFFLHVPGVFEQQLNYSTTLIFDEPSFCNGVQVSGYVPRVVRELVISLIAQLRRCQYSLTHHAVLGVLTARKHKLSDTEITEKWCNLLAPEKTSAYTRLELAAIKFATHFATNPKAYSTEDYTELQAAFAEENSRVYWEEGGWLAQLQKAREARAYALATGKTGDKALDAARAAALGTSRDISNEENERKINAQVTELAFIALQFVALTGVFSSLNVPDEDFLPATLEQVVPKALRDVIAAILGGTTDGMMSLVPPRIEPPAAEILGGQVMIEPAAPRGTRIPLKSWESEPAQGTRDKGLAIGGIHVGVYGWSFGSYFPGSLTYALMHHGELARFEAPYSLPVLFNEDQWRNGTQTAGYNRPIIKELVIQKVYHLLRSRYGLEHHTMFFFNAVQQEFGVGAFRLKGLTDEQHADALQRALKMAEALILNLDVPENAPEGIFSPLHMALLKWVEALVVAPHTAHTHEPKLREALLASNKKEIGAGIRQLDRSGTVDEPVAMKRLIDHQIAELAMMAGHMDGLGRFLTILQLESETAVSTVKTVVDADNVVSLQFTGAMSSRPSLFDALRFCNVPESVLTYNELLANPQINTRVREALGRDPNATVHIKASTVTLTAEF
jgi:hypothetical protein